MTVERETNPIERLQRALRARLPGAELELDPAETSTGGWFLDARLEGHHVVVEWRSGQGFGITSNPELDYGQGADETIADEAAALARMVELLEARRRTSAAGIGELRRARGLRQEDLAGALGVGQAAVSRLESRRDWKLSTLRDVVAAMGGRLEVRAVFDNGETREITLEDDAGAA